MDFFYNNATNCIFFFRKETEYKIDGNLATYVKSSTKAMMCFKKAFQESKKIIIQLSWMPYLFHVKIRLNREGSNLIIVEIY